MPHFKLLLLGKLLFAWKDLQNSNFLHCRKLRLANEHIEQRKRAGRTPEEAVNLTSIELARTADAHCRAFLVQSGYEMIEKSCTSAPPELARALRDIYELYAYDEAMKAVGDLLRVSSTGLMQLLIHVHLNNSFLVHNHQ